MVWGETPRSVAMANSVQSSKMSRRICSSRVDSLSERAIPSHACPDSIVERGADRRERPALPALTRLFTPPHMDWTNYFTDISHMTYAPRLSRIIHSDEHS